MLVLSRMLDEAIMIGEDIEITVLEVKGDKVKLGISAPSKIPVHRKEIYLAIKEENIKARSISQQELEKVSKLFTQKPKP